MLKVLKFITGVLAFIAIIILIKVSIVFYIQKENRTFLDQLNRNNELFNTYNVNQFLLISSPASVVNDEQMMALSGVDDLDLQNKFNKEVKLNSHGGRMFQNAKRNISPISETNKLQDSKYANSKKKESGFLTRLFTNSDDKNSNIDEHTLDLAVAARHHAHSFFMKSGLVLPFIPPKTTSYFFNIFSGENTPIYSIKLNNLYHKLSKLDFNVGSELVLLHFCNRMINIYDVADSGRENILRYRETVDMLIDSVKSFSKLVKDRGLRLEGASFKNVWFDPSFSGEVLIPINETQNPKKFDKTNYKSEKEVANRNKKPSDSEIEDSESNIASDGVKQDSIVKETLDIPKESSKPGDDVTTKAE